MRLTHGGLTLIGTWPRCVLLSHTGAKSGIERATPLIYFTDDDRVILVASNYGGARHPAWYYNVKANPNVTLCAGGFEGRFVGQEVSGAEYDRLWALPSNGTPATTSTKHLPETERYRWWRSRLPVRPTLRNVNLNDLRENRRESTVSQRFPRQRTPTLGASPPTPTSGSPSCNG